MKRPLFCTGGPPGSASCSTAPARCCRGLPGLEPDAVYRLTPLAPGDRPQGPTSHALPWRADGVELTGRMLAVTGVQAPVQFPERLVLVRASIAA